MGPFMSHFYLEHMLSTFAPLLPFSSRHLAPELFYHAKNDPMS